MDISRLSRQNKNYKFIMNVIDVYSRYVWSFPLKNKEASSVGVELRKVIEEIKKKYPINTLTLTTDQGKEYEGAVKKLCEEYHRENALVQIANDPVIIPVAQIEKPLTKEEALIQDINSCTELKVLQSYQLIVKSKPEFQEAYNNKLKKLQNGL